MNAEGTDGEYLVIVDADRIHDYVFSPQQLKLIRGGSAILRDLSDEQLLEIATGEPFHGEVVVAAGGKLIAIFPNLRAAEGFRNKTVETFRRRTATATATSVSIPMGVWKDTLESADTALEREKSGRKERRFSGGSPYWKTCECCGLHPAAHVYLDEDNKERFPCEACYLRHIEGKKNENGEIRNFETLANGSSPEGYLALVYLDGNRMGKFISDRGSETREAYRDVSNRVRDAVKLGIEKGCEATGRPSEILLIGGDDAIVMLQAQSVFAFLNAFHANCQVEGLTFSAGVVWAHHHFPIAQFVRRAEALLGAAKRANGTAEPQENRVDFEIVTESMSLATKHQEKKWTKRPYLMEDLNALVTGIQAWKVKGMPTNKVKALYEISRMGKDQAVLEYCFLLSRLTPEHRVLMLAQIPDTFWNGDPPQKTAAGDLAELWDFVAE